MKRDLIKRSLSIFLVVTMVFSIILHAKITAHADEVHSNVITKANITDLEGKPITEPMPAWKAFRINAEYALPNNQVKEGDTTTLTLPKGFSPASPFDFEIKAGNDVVANGQIVDGNPAKVVITYTKYAQEHSGVKGSFYFNIQINSNTQTQTGIIPVTLTAKGDGTVVQAGTVTYNPQQVSPVQVIKGGWMDSKDKTIGHYKISINQSNKEMVNAKVTDELLNPGVQYVENSFQILEGKWVKNATGTDILFTNEVDVTAKYKDKLKIEGNKFTLDIGNRPEGKGLMIRYKVKISYEPVVGEEFKNKVELIDAGKTFKHNTSYKIIDASGGGAGYVYKIKVHKKGNDGSSLSGAMFDVIRVRNNQKVGTITTGTDGKGELGNLVLDRYKLVETKAPDNYLPLKDPVYVEEKDFDENSRIALKTIENKLNEKISIPVIKKWIGPAKDSVTVQLKKVGSNDVIQEHELKASENWTYTFTGLNKYETDGSEIKYEVVEKNVPEGYISEITGTMQDGFTITNKNTEKVKIPVEKKWEDNNNQDGKRVKEIVVRLVKNDIPTDKIIKLNEQNNWKGEFTDLDKYDAQGNKIKYTVKEETVVEGYDTEIIAGQVDGVLGYIIKNKHNVEKTEIPVEKKWIGPASVEEVTVKLFADGVDTGKTLTLKKSENWKGKFTNLDKYKNGKEIVYTIKEAKVEGYESKVEGNAKDGFVITNRNIEKTEVPVEKKWIGKALKEVEVKLLANGQEVQTVKLNEANSWKHTFKNLPKYDENGKEITYTVKETKVEGYESKVEGNAKDGFVITNKNLAKTEVPVEKKWLGKAVNEIEVKLLANGQEVQSAKLNEGNSWKHTFKDLPVYDDNGKEITYTVKETKVEGYESKIEGNVKDGFVITNKNLAKTEVPVEKKWIGKALKEVEVKLLANGQEVQSAKLNEANSWKHTFKDLPVYDDNGKEITYTVKEVAIEGYESKIEGNAKDGFVITNKNVEKTEVPVEKKWIGKAVNEIEVKLLANGKEVQTAKLNEANSWKHTFKDLPVYDDNGKEITYTVKEVAIEGYESKIEGNAKDGFVITNKNLAKTEVPVEKKWLGKAVNEIEVKLLANGKEVQTAKLNEVNSWKHTFKDLPVYDNNGKEITYIVKEVAIEGYESKIEGNAKDGFVITNKNLAKTEVPVEKKWLGKAVNEIEVKLLANGKEVQSAKLNEVNSWKHTFKDLPVYDNNGKEITYTVKEVAIEGYESKIEGNAKDGFVITNKNVEKTEVPVEKKWLGKSVNEIEVKLLANGKEVQTAKLNEANSWKHTFKDLPVYDENGKEIVYTVKEVAIEGYESKIEGNAKDGFVITNKEIPKKPKLAKTGIGTSASIYSGILAISGGIMVFLKKRNQKKNTSI
ncbi:Cna B-type domain-containing protein [Parvimonas micra]|uniref:Cna B-type domain-containing protein n=1 Tax=Parvimonas micra TaxID=33033 RepID=A0AAX3K5T8_9FIRM|nr:Cna B-type domain-containing protein [Parvimonas micra]WBB30579.1 Cna B-type domain-containing protein [Parvimonas micra]